MFNLQLITFLYIIMQNVMFYIPAIIYAVDTQIYYKTKYYICRLLNTDPICLLYRVFHETQTAMAMAVVVTMVATVVGAVVHAVKVRISVPSLLFCISLNVLLCQHKPNFEFHNHSTTLIFSTIITLSSLPSLAFHPSTITSSYFL